MKLSVFSALLLSLVQIFTLCEASKTWNVDDYEEETFCVFRWIAYIKKLFLIALTLSAVILYYVPESRSYARKACCMLVDLVADSLKAILSGSDDRNCEFRRGKFRSEYRLWKYGKLPEICRREIGESDDLTIYEPRKHRNSKTLVVRDEEEIVRSQEIGRRYFKRNRDDDGQNQIYNSKSYGASIGDVPLESCVEISSSTHVCQDYRIDDVRKLVRSKFYCANGKKSTHRSLDNYATFLISGSPREMAMIDEKYEKDDIVILREPCKQKRRRKQHGMSLTKLAVKEKEENSTLEGARKNLHIVGKEVEMDRSSIVDTINTTICDSDGGSIDRYGQDDHRSSFRGPTSTSTFIDDWNAIPTYKSAMSGVNPEVNNCRKKKGLEKRSSGIWKTEGPEDVTSCKVHFLQNGKEEEEVEEEEEEELTEDSLSKRSRFVEDIDLDEWPQRENNIYRKMQQNSSYEKDCPGVPMADNWLDLVGPRPALRRVINWVFGSCPSGSTVQEEMSDHLVGKEEIQNIARGSMLGGSASRENHLRFCASDTRTSDGIGRD